MQKATYCVVPFIETSKIDKAVEIEGGLVIARGCRGARIGESLFNRCACVAQSVKHQTSAQATISRFVGSRLASGSVLTAGACADRWSLLRILCLSLSAPSLLVLAHSLSLSKINKKIGTGFPLG